MYRSHCKVSLALLVITASCLHGVTSHCTSSFCDTNNDYNLLRKLADTQDTMIQVLANRGQTMTSLEEQVTGQRGVLQTQDERIRNLEEMTTNYTKAFERALTEERQLVAALRRNITNIRRGHEREMANVAIELVALKKALASVREELSGLQRPPPVPTYDCADLLREGHTVSGVYDIYLSKSRTRVPVYCDMETDGGGWLVFQRRVDGSVDFYRDWDSYKAGFGNESAEFWLGNDVLQEITSQKRYQLRIDLEDFQGATKYATYSNVFVAPEKDNYRLTLGTHSGTAEDSMSGCNAQSFSTVDRDNDASYDNCAKAYKGGWWYDDSHYANLNGRYLSGPHASYADGIEWSTWHGFYYSLKRVEMKLRP